MAVDGVADGVALQSNPLANREHRGSFMEMDTGLPDVGAGVDQGVITHMEANPLARAQPTRVSMDDDALFPSGASGDAGVGDTVFHEEFMPQRPKLNVDTADAMEGEGAA